MTKEELINILQTKGEYWTVSKYYCEKYGDEQLYWFTRIAFTNYDEHKNIIDFCVKYPDLIMFDFDNNRIFLLNRFINKFYRIPSNFHEKDHNTLVNFDISLFLKYYPASLL